MRVSGKDSPGEVMLRSVEIPCEESTQGMTGEARGAWSAIPSLARLNYDRISEADRALHHVGDSDVQAVFHVADEHIWLLPRKAPGVFHGDDSVRSGNYPSECEASVEIGLISADEFLMQIGIFWNKNHHGSGDALISAFCKPLNRCNAF